MEETNIPVRIDDSGCRFLKYRTKVGARVSRASVLVVYEKDGHKLSVISPEVGTVSWLMDDLKEGDHIPPSCTLIKLTPCDHPVVMKDMCADCGKDLRSKDGLPGDREVSTNANTAMIHSLPELLITENEAIAQGAADEKSLLASRKLVLLVDLDQTLIHTTNEHVNSNLKNVEHFKLYGPNSVWYHTKLRPHAKEFLKNLTEFYELHICTFGVRLYAHTVARILDETGELFRQRILSRNECFDPSLKAANLKALFPCGDRLVCIIDDREDVWNFARNVVHVKPYRYFKHTGDINAPPGFAKTDRNTEHEFQFQHPKHKEDVGAEPGKDGEVVADTSEDDRNADGKKSAAHQHGRFPDVEDDEVLTSEEEDQDDYLHYLEDVLKRIHAAFYQCHDKLTARNTGEIPDVKTIIPYVKQKVFKGTRVVFSGMIPTNQQMESSMTYKLAVAFGARIQDQIVPKDKATDDSPHTTHLIAAKWGTSKVHQATKLGYVKIVNPDWFWCCVERWEMVDELLFPLPNGEVPELRPQKETSLLEGNQADGGPGMSHSSHLVSLTQEELRRMSEEVEDALSDDDSDEEKREQNSDSEDSLTGQTPRGWKRKSCDLQVDQDLEGTTEKRIRDEDEAESDGNLEDDDDEGDSVGSVDDEMAAALEREIA